MVALTQIIVGVIFGHVRLRFAPGAVHNLEF